MRQLCLLLLAVLLLTSTACYRTRYLSFSPGSPTQASAVAQPTRVSGWQSFWVLGLVPGARLLEADERCGSTDAIDSIETQQRFAQGLINAVAGTVYSPWNAAIYCVHEP